MGRLGALAQNEQAVAHTTRRFHEGVSCHAIANEVYENFGITASYNAIRSFMRRYDIDATESKTSKAEELRAKRNRDVENDARAGYSFREIAQRYGISVGWVSRIVELAGGISERDYSLRHSILEKIRRSKLFDRPCDDRLDGEVTIAGKIFAELGDHECRFPIGKDADGNCRFCGEPRAMDRRVLRRPYCEKHGDAATLPGEPFCGIADWMLTGYASANNQNATVVVTSPQGYVKYAKTSEVTGQWRVEDDLSKPLNPIGAYEQRSEEETRSRRG